MIKKLFSVMAIAACIAAVPAHSQPAQRGLITLNQCSFNCVLVQRTAATLMVSVLDDRGHVTHGSTSQLAKGYDAGSFRLSAGGVSGEALAIQPMNDGGVTTRSSSVSYRTATEIIVVVVVSYYNSKGQLIDVKVYETRYPLIEK